MNQETFDVVTLIDKSEQEVIDILQSSNTRYRVVSRDGKPNFVTMDYQPERINLAVVDGQVVSIHKG